jgi:hypothetical protein
LKTYFLAVLIPGTGYKINSVVDPDPKVFAGSESAFKSFGSELKKSFGSAMQGIDG